MHLISIVFTATISVREGLKLDIELQLFETLCIKFQAIAAMVKVACI